MSKLYDTKEMTTVSGEKVNVKVPLKKNSTQLNEEKSNIDETILNLEQLIENLEDELKSYRNRRTKILDIIK